MAKKKNKKIIIQPIDVDLGDVEGEEEKEAIKTQKDILLGRDKKEKDKGEN